MTATIAQGQHPGPYFHADLGISIVQDIDTSVAGVPGRLELDPGPRFSIGAGYVLYTDAAYETAVQFETGVIYNSPSKLKGDGFESSADGDFYQVPFLADIIYSFKVTPRLAPYIGIGGGGVYSRLSINNLDGFPVDSSTDEFDAAVQAMAGLRYKLDERNELGVGYKFLATFPKDVDYVGTHSLSLVYMLRF